MTTSLDLIEKRVRDCELKAATLEGQRKADLSRKTELTTKVASAKARTALSEEIYRIFDALQNKAHERSVGAFERLLTALLSDVLPEEGKVKLLTEFKNNDTYLDILLEKQGCLEDVLEGNGGAVTNVLSMGLRFAALTRTKNRRLMLLDEPDCWVSVEKIPQFIKVVSEVSKQINTQTFFITHHEVTLFEGKANVIKFKKEPSGKISCEVLEPRVSSWKNDSEPGIRAIELINVRTHEHTLVPCFPGANAFIGANNLGKSTAIISSFKAVAYGESDDSLIAHGKSDATIYIHLENNMKLGWTRAKKKTPAVEYFLLDETGAEIKRGPQKGRNQAPDWVVDILGISRVDDMDIQIRNQKNPVFLLNDSAPKRAKILSVGKESSYLKDLSKLYDEIKVSDRETIKNGEAELSRIVFRLKFFEKLEASTEVCNQLVYQSKPLVEKISNIKKIEQSLEKLEKLENHLAHLTKQNLVLSGLKENVPVIEDTEKLTKLVAAINKGLTYSKFSTPAEVYQPELHDLTTLLQLGKKISLGLKAVSQYEKIKEVPEVQAPVVEDVEPLLKQGLSISKSIKECDRLQKELDLLSAQELEQENSVKEIKETLKICPLCGSDFENKGNHDHH